MSNSVQNKDDSMNVPDQMDVVKDELDIKDELDVKDELGVEDDFDVKDELEPIVGSSTDLMTTEFKDEFSEETEIDPLNQDGQSSREDAEKVSMEGDQDKGSTDDQDTEGDSINDAEEVEEDIPEHQEEGLTATVEETELLTTDMEQDDTDPLDDPLMAGDDPLDDEVIDPMDNGTDDCLEDLEAVEGDEILEGDEVDGDEVVGDEVAMDDVDTEDGLEQDMEGVDPLDPLAEESSVKTGTKRKSDQTDKPEEVAVRKSSRIKQNQESKKCEKEDVMLQGKSVHDAQKEKLKMLQKPTERPTRLNTDDEQSESEKTSDTEKEEEVLLPPEEKVQSGDRSRLPGADAKRKIDQDFLLPFRFGWTREVVIRPGKTGPPQIDIFYWPPKGGEDHGPRNREARRKRRSKVDQERYFEEFKSEKLSVNNFSYVRRPLDLNNEAYEIIRRNSKPSLETRSDRTRAGKVASYKEVAEHEGLLSGDESEEEGSAEVDDEIEDITEFDQGLPLSLQILRKITPLREESKKRRKFPNRDRCITPPLAEDIPWTLLDDDPLGIYTELGGRSSPATPPPLRAVRLTSHPTINNINNKINNILCELVDPLVRITESNRDLELKENLASHDTAIKKFKNFRPNPPPTHRSLQPGRPMNRQGVPRPNTAIRQQPQQNRPSNNTNTPGYVKVRLPMLSTNGKRPVVELVMLTNGKYQPIKFTNNRQVTESIPKRLFDQATGMRKTLYQRSVQVPKIGTKQVFIAINPSPGGSRPFNGNVPQQQPPPQRQQQKPVHKSPGVTEQVSILVRPAQGGNAVLLNVPRHVALKVKIGTTLSFSASNEQKYTVIDNKMHPPVGKSGSSRPPPQRPPQRPLPNLPAGVSIRPINRRPQVRPQFGRSPQAAVKQMQNKTRTPPGLVRNSVSNFSPCSPFCPGVTGIPELECSSCHSLFHPVCVGIPQSRIHQIQNAFRCKACSNRPGGGGGGPSPIQVIDLD